MLAFSAAGTFTAAAPAIGSVAAEESCPQPVTAAGCGASGARLPGSFAVFAQGPRTAADARTYDLALKILLGAGGGFSVLAFLLAALPRRVLSARRLGAAAEKSSELALWGFVVAVSLAVGLLVVNVAP